MVLSPRSVSCWRSLLLLLPRENALLPSLLSCSPPPCPPPVFLHRILLICQSVIDDSKGARMLVGQLSLTTKRVQGVLEIRKLCRVLVTLFKCLIAFGGLPVILLNSLLATENILSLLILMTHLYLNRPLLGGAFALLARPIQMMLDPAAQAGCPPGGAVTGACK